MKSPHILTMFLAASALALTSVNAQTTVTSDVVGYTTSTLTGGVGNIYAPSFVRNASASGALTSVTSGTTLSTNATLSPAVFNETTSVSGVSKGYPRYYVEFTNDSDSDDGFDTAGLIVDVVSNTSTDIVVSSDVTALGVKGDESFVIREHVTLGSLFSGSTGLGAYSDAITIYNEDGPGTAVTHISDGAGGFLLNDFTTSSTDAPIYPGTGFVINNPSNVSITATGTVKESPTQVSVYGGSVVNIISVMQPKSSVSLGSELHTSLVAYTDVCTPYTTDGSLTATTGFMTTGSGSFVETDFITSASPTVDGTSQGIVVSAAVNTVVKLSGNDI
jgi:hypothetical protein